MLMLKADAYGHGAVAVAKSVCREVDYFAVATVAEGVELRNAGVTKPILVMMAGDYELERAAEHNLFVSLSNFNQIKRAAQIAETCPLKAHIAINTGMNRLGFSEGELKEAVKLIKASKIEVDGIYSHLRVRSYRQIKCFERLSQSLKADFPDAMLHLAASRTLSVKRIRFDGVRVGLKAYTGAMSVVSEVIKTASVDANEFISYGTYKTKSSKNIAVVFGGYADGISLKKPSSVYINGNKCRVLSKVCMDMFIVDVGENDVKVGDKVVLYDALHSADVIKERATTPYEILTCWHGRTERIYISRRK